ncbi:MAG: hypothetical protein N2039_04505, partial [Gemmataceae bacterium]|nr:hypothetical protein [Gemmataceae bacterium]
CADPLPVGAGKGSAFAEYWAGRGNVVTRSCAIPGQAVTIPAIAIHRPIFRVATAAPPNEIPGTTPR